MSKQVENSELEASNILAVLLNTNNRISCDNMDQLEIKVSVVSGTSIVASKTLSFADNQIVAFDSLPQGVYNCTISVIVGTTTMESLSYQCTINSMFDYSSKFLWSMIFGEVEMNSNF